MDDCLTACLNPDSQAPDEIWLSDRTFDTDPSRILIESSEPHKLRFRLIEWLAGSPNRQVKSEGALARWEKLYFNPFPSNEQLEALGKLIGVTSDRLAEMFPSKGTPHQPKPIKLCGACYAEVPCHQIAWQSKSPDVIIGCDRHQLRLLSNCPQCKKPFLIPALWVEGKCKNRSLPFAKMAKFQRAL